jgi:hypothetical protein
MVTVCNPAVTIHSPLVHIQLDRSPATTCLTFFRKVI